MPTLNDAPIAVIGLGYVGLPLAVEFGKKRKVVGFDINAARIDELKSGRDSTLEVEPDELGQATHLTYASDAAAMADCNVYIVTVPTPITESKQPDIPLLKKASETIGRVLKRGDIVIYESTVYPGATEDDCVPVLEATSGLRFNIDFFAGYSPERINPGDREHTIEKITKVVAGQTPEVLDAVADLYGAVTSGGTFRAASIKAAEAAKVIENAQRDINIAFVNEVAQILGALDISVYDVLETAATKWNFLDFCPLLSCPH